MTLEKKTFENIVGKGKNAGNQYIPLFPQWFLLFVHQISFFQPCKSFSRQHFYSSKPKEFEDNNFEYNEMVQSSLKQVENTVEMEKLLVMSNFSFPTVFSKDLYCRHIKIRACLGKG